MWIPSKRLKLALLVFSPATSRYSPAKVGRFIWNDDHQAHLYDGRPLTLEEFNPIAKHIFYQRRDEIETFDLPPYVQLIEETAAEPEPAAEAPARRIFKRKGDLIPIPDLQPA